MAVDPGLSLAGHRGLAPNLVYTPRWSAEQATDFRARWNGRQST